MTTARTLLYAVLGHPVRHSRSPEIHGRWLAEHRIDAVYLALDVDPARADQVADAVRTLRIDGANLTVPLKERVLDALDALAPSAAAAGAVNTLVRDGVRLIGHNTDGDGLFDALHHQHGEVPVAVAVVLGAGGAARGVAAALATRGAAEVHVLNRSVDRAERLARDLGERNPATRFTVHPLAAEAFARLAPAADLVVDATTCAPGVERLDPALLPDHAVWADLSYWRAEAPGLSRAAARGLRVHDGLGMLVFQAARAFTLFTGHVPDAARTLDDARAAW